MHKIATYPMKKNILSIKMKNKKVMQNLIRMKKSSTTDFAQGIINELL